STGLLRLRLKPKEKRTLKTPSGSSSQTNHVLKQRGYLPFGKAISTARRGSMTPQPWRSTSWWGRRSAVEMRIFLISDGVRFGLASIIWAATDETIGAANDVPSTYL